MLLGRGLGACIVGGCGRETGGWEAASFAGGFGGSGQGEGMGAGELGYSGTRPGL